MFFLGNFSVQGEVDVFTDFVVTRLCFDLIDIHDQNEALSKYQLIVKTKFPHFSSFGFDNLKKLLQ